MNFPQLKLLVLFRKVKILICAIYSDKDTNTSAPVQETPFSRSTFCRLSGTTLPARGVCVRHYSDRHEPMTIELKLVSLRNTYRPCLFDLVFMSTRVVVVVVVAASVSVGNNEAALLTSHLRTHSPLSSSAKTQLEATQCVVSTVQLLYDKHLFFLSPLC